MGSVFGTRLARLIPRGSLDPAVLVRPRCAPRPSLSRRRHASSSSRSTSSPDTSSGAGSSTLRAAHVIGREWAILIFGVAAGIGGTYAYTQRSKQSGLSLSLDGENVNWEIKKAKPAEHQPREGSISIAQLEEHGGEDSLWVAIDGDVWDVTSFVNLHPGGPDILYENAGKDVTKLFKGIHPAGTLESNTAHVKKVGRLNAEALEAFEEEDDGEEARIERAREALISVNGLSSIRDIETFAQPLIADQAWEYYSTGAETESAMHNNSSVFDNVTFRPRVMRDVAEVDISTTILNVPVTVPFYVSPTARNGLTQPLGEVAVTLGAGKQGILQVLSHVASKSLEEVLAAAKEGQKIGWQLYMDPDREAAEKDIQRAAAAGAHSIWLTVDTTILGRRIRSIKGMLQRKNYAPDSPFSRDPVTSKLSPRHDAKITWEDIQWIKSLAPGLPVIVKGVGAWEDVVLAKKYGADAVVLSNHGGRQLDYADAPLKTLWDLNQHAPETIHSPGFQIFVDGGIRRGTDVLKALCLGANAVGLGRPFIYAATGWGPDGVEKAIMILREEIEVSMRLLGVTKLDQLGPEYVNCSKL